MYNNATKRSITNIYNLIELNKLLIGIGNT